MLSLKYRTFSSVLAEDLSVFPFFEATFSLLASVVDFLFFVGDETIWGFFPLGLLADLGAVEDLRDERECEIEDRFGNEKGLELIRLITMKSLDLNI